MTFNSHFEEAKYYYDRGEWSAKRLQALVAKGWLTEEEYDLIIGE